jgi:hypothetical protein
MAIMAQRAPNVRERFEVESGQGKGSQLGARNLCRHVASPAADAERVAFLFGLYQKDTSLVPATVSAKGKRKLIPRGKSDVC